jgi:hypothetical protein
MGRSESHYILRYSDRIRPAKLIYPDTVKLVVSHMIQHIQNDARAADLSCDGVGVATVLLSISSFRHTDLGSGFSLRIVRNRE